MDGEFDKDGLVGDVAELGINVNCMAAEERVPEIERHIWTIKERSRNVVNILPFKQLPARIIVIELIHYVVFEAESRCLCDSYSVTAAFGIRCKHISSDHVRTVNAVWIGSSGSR